MHLLPPLLLLASLSTTLASPFSITPDVIRTIIEKEAQTSVNNTSSCPADPVKAAEKLVFESSKSRRRQLAPYAPYRFFFSA
jgi:hypothetical protein